MSSKVLFIYDGECPFCNQFAELLELKSNVPDIEVKNAREHPSDMPLDYDMDVSGAILLKDDEMLNGAEAINWICSQIKDPSDNLLQILAITFSSKKRTRYIFPLLLIARRIALRFKGIPVKIAGNNN